MYELVRASPVITLLIIVGFARSALAANPRAESGALDAISKAEGDFLAMNYASGAARLDKALRACAPSNCAAATQAALLRDIGTMEFRAGDKGFATKAFTEALKLQPTIDLNPSYDSPDLRAAWVEVKGGPAPSGAAAPPATGSTPAAGAGVPPPPTFPQPTGDFAHVPAAEQKIDTPLPIFVEGGANGVAHVIVRYKNSEEGDEAEWNHMNLQRMGAGWGGVLPCNAVVGGTMRYYIQGYNKDMDPIATNGDAKTPYQVPIREELSGQPPRLPNRPPAKSCHPAKMGKVVETAAAPAAEEKDTSAADCPPGMPGCGKAEKPAEDEEAKAAAEEESDQTKDGKKRKKRGKDFPRWWIGVGVHLDFMQIPSGNDLCRLQPGGPHAGQPANDRHFYCTDSSGADFPTRLWPVQNDQLSQKTAGQSSGGIVPGNLRLMLSVDYAATTNVLVGVRGGYALFAYPGSAAANEGYASGQKFYLEARVTAVLGKDPLAKAGAAPVFFVGTGMSPFDAHTSDVAGICLSPMSRDEALACNPPGNQAPPNKPIYPGTNRDGKPTPTQGGPPPGAPAVPVDLWITNGPFFVGLGGGIRYAPIPRVALIGALRLNLSFGSNGVIPTVGPEVDVQVGF